ncbi:helix-turn-helix transcriptional regulator [Kitasatospora sp. NPDC001175]|uniref:helix-turn-helix transcriptional regulator n=1 Tax=Kitasatospora sp. NPDC001175 TaxID=3157103 RepID=UPI003CFD66E4
MDRYLTTAEVAQRYRTAESTVRYWRHAGYGPRGVKVGRRVLYAETELARFDQELREQGSQWVLGA